MKKILLIVLSTLFIPFAYAQKVRNKDVKRAIEQGKISEIALLLDDQFTPGKTMEFDLRATLDGGTTVLASEFGVLWESTTLTVDNSPYKIKGEFLSNGKGVLKPRDPAAYYPQVQIHVTAQLSGKKAEKVLTPFHCYSDFKIQKFGARGLSGNRDTSIDSPGANGIDGTNGSPAPDLTIEVKEEMIGDILHVILTINGDNYPLDPACSRVIVVSRGGDGGSGSSGLAGRESPKNSDNEYTRRGGSGGKGGDGGRAGNGGTITVSGLYEKYRNVVTFVSEGGTGGSAGNGGRGGSGSTDGTEGMDGRSGMDGAPGQVIFKN